MPITSIVSINQLITWFQTFQENHYMLKDFGFGETYDIGTSRQMNFPYLWVTLNDDNNIATGSNIKSAIPDLSFSIMMMDKINIQENYLDTNGFPSDNSQEIISDCLQYVQDLIVYIQQNWGQYGVLISQDTSFFPVIDETPDKATGILARIVLRTRQVNCVIPESPTSIVITPQQATYATLLTCETLGDCSTFQTYAYTGISYNTGTTVLSLTSLNGHQISVSGFTPGTSGTSGSSGQNGTSGSSGANGSTGSSGQSGSNGTSGTSGSSGQNGTSGSSGDSGTSGSSGANGSSGSSGESGTSGSSGESGSSGSSGINGNNGSSGSSGESGTSGSSGVNGSSGSSGDSGTSGSSGVNGSSGSSGINGVSSSVFYYEAKNNAQSGNPGSGHILWNNVTMTASTQININHLTDTPVTDIDIFLALLQVGQQITIQDQSNSGNYQVWTITGATTQIVGASNYWEVPVSLVSAAGTAQFPNNHKIILATLGATGSSGSSGSSGANGSSGSSGNSGTSGSSGESGSSGISGSSGSSGNSGSSGSSGETGTSGSSGANGNNGSSGSSGANGNNGSSGSSGVSGTSGTSSTAGGSGVVGSHFQMITTGVTFLPVMISPSGSGAGYGPSNNTASLLPFIPLRDISTTGVTTEVAVVGATGVYKICCYDSGGDGLPRTLLFSSSELSGATLGFKTYTGNYTFSAGTQYWIGVYGSASTAMRLRNATGTGLLPIPTPSQQTSGYAIMLNLTSGTYPTVPTSLAGVGPSYRTSVEQVPFVQLNKI